MQLTAEAKEDVRDLDRSAQRLVLRALKKLEVSPEQRGAPLGSHAGNLTSFRKLVVGNRDYRVIYRIEADGAVVIVWVVSERADEKCYELALSRIRMYQDRGLAEGLERMITNVWSNTEPEE